MAVVPVWLQQAHDDRGHVARALAVLDDREHTRFRARSSTRGQQINVNLRHRLSAAIAHTKSPLADHYSISEGCRPENLCCNRYADIEPYDRTRVLANGRYFNGNWVRELYGGRWVIATQAPLPETAHEFLSILAGTSALHTPGKPGQAVGRVRTVVQLTRNVEQGRRKADTYFPTTPGESWVVRPRAEGSDLPDLKITLLRSESIDSAQCISSTVAVAVISKGGTRQPVLFHHLLYHAWPDHGVPDPANRAGLLNFIRLADRTNKDTTALGTEPSATADTEPPLMVNCSAGVGRTGAFIALLSLLRFNGILEFRATAPSTSDISSPYPSPLHPSPLGPLPNDLGADAVAQEIDSLREQRPGMVQRPEQAVLVYEVLYSAFLARDRVMNGPS